MDFVILASRTAKTGQDGNGVIAESSVVPKRPCKVME